jgi:putative nucleotidyltransferase with HDIG domain
VTSHVCPPRGLCRVMLDLLTIGLADGGRTAVRSEPVYCRHVVTSDVARELAGSELAVALPRRWLHVQAVAAQAARLSAVPGVARDVLVVAAWLHDIGYAPDLVDTGFHPIDGARFLRKLGADDRLVCLVAHHSCAVYEARVRGLEGVLLAEFPCNGKNPAVGCPAAPIGGGVLPRFGRLSADHAVSK